MPKIEIPQYVLDSLVVIEKNWEGDPNSMHAWCHQFSGDKLHIREGCLHYPRELKEYATTVKIYKDISFPVSNYSWEKPLEDELMEFLDHMIRNIKLGVGRLDTGILGFLDSGEKNRGKGLIQAYETMRNHIIDQVTLRKRVESLKKNAEILEKGDPSKYATTINPYADMPGGTI